MGIERTTVSAKLKPENLLWIDAKIAMFRQAFPPVEVSRSAITNASVSYCREIDLSAADLQALLRNARAPSLPVMVGPICVDPLHTVLVHINDFIEQQRVLSPRKAEPERVVPGRAAGEPSPEVHRRRALRDPERKRA